MCDFNKQEKQVIKKIYESEDTEIKDLINKMRVVIFMCNVFNIMLVTYVAEEPNISSDLKFIAILFGIFSISSIIEVGIILAKNKKVKK